jgi:hypothetical protein
MDTAAAVGNIRTVSFKSKQANWNKWLLLGLAVNVHAFLLISAFRDSLTGEFWDWTRAIICDTGGMLGAAVLVVFLLRRHWNLALNQAVALGAILYFNLTIFHFGTFAYRYMEPKEDLAGCVLIHYVMALLLNCSAIAGLFWPSITGKSVADEQIAA